MSVYPDSYRSDNFMSANDNTASSTAETQSNVKVEPNLSPESAMASLVFPGIARRMTAYLIDLVIVGVLGFLTFMLVLWEANGTRLAEALSMMGGGNPYNGTGGIGGLVLFLALTNVAYHVTMESRGKLRGTVGKLFLGLAVTDLHGNLLTPRRALARAVSRTLPIVTCGLLYLLCAFGGRGRSLHDRMTGSVVVVRYADAAQVQMAMTGRRKLRVLDWLTMVASLYLVVTLAFPVGAKVLVKMLGG